MRDGVEIAMTVRLPQGKTLADGPFPTIIEYSGYQTAAPHDLLQSVIDSLGGSGAPADPLAPATSTAVGSLIAPLIGFAVVSVQMRGSGCSGGAFDLFDYPTTFDGYDAVETVGAQSWVKGGKVGMGGISFSGITQLFTAGTRPPHLAAVTPMSVTDDIYTGTGYPGGIFNSGFAQTWIQERMDDAKPAPDGGQPWARELVKQGDKHCIANQKLRLQTQDALQLQKENPFRTPSLFAHRAPGAWLKRAKVPIFLVGQFQDEQTSGHFAEALKYLNGKPNVFLSLQNGVHADSLGPKTITRWAEFLNLYVADKIPGSSRHRDQPQRPALPVPGRRRRGARRAVSLRELHERGRRQGRLQEGPARPPPVRQRRRPAGRGLDRFHVGARLQRLAAQASQGHALLPRRGRLAGRQAGQGGLGQLHGRSERPPAPDARRATAPRTPGRRSRRTTGLRSPPARAWAGSPARWPRTP